MPESESKPQLDEAQIIEITKRIDFARVRERIRASEERYERHKRSTKHLRIVINV